jgi:hypothetical protein
MDETSTQGPGAIQTLAGLSPHHREAIAAMDFFTVPTIRFGVLYCFFVIAHDRRRILHWVAERWVETCRRDLFDHVIVVNERHLKRFLSDYVRYYHEDRTHLGLGKGTPAGRACSTNAGRAYDRLGGLHHRYDRAA